MMFKVYMEIAPVPAIMPAAPPPAAPALPAPAPTMSYLKWAIGIFIVVSIVLLLRPYFPVFIKLFELTKTGVELMNKPKEAVIGPKLEVNKEEPPPPEPNMEYCYVGEWKGIRSCVRVDSSQCSSKTYSTESQCVNPN